MALSPTGFSGGMQVPVQTGRTGGFRLISGDDYVIQLISVLVGDTDSENPFLQIGFGLEVIFANLSDSGWRTQQKQKITDLFRDLERAQIAKLLGVEYEDGPGTAEVTAVVKFLSIETGKVLDVRTPLRRS